MTNNANRLEPYIALSDVYQQAGLSDYSTALAPRLLELAFDLEWTGRTLLDLACGTGDAACWFAEHGFRVLGVDLSERMLSHGIHRADDAGLSAEFVQGDIRTFAPQVQFELVTCLGGSLNYIPTLRDLENVFRQVYAALVPGKLFVFDLRTIQGLAKGGTADKVLFDNGKDTLMIARDTFSFETLQMNRQYIIFCGSGSGWIRADEVHPLRGYPVQAIVSLLNKVGFKLRQTMTADLEVVDSQRDADQLIFVAGRER